MFNYEDIIVEIRGHIALIKFNRPKVLNAMRDQTKHELENAIDTLNADNNIYGIMITGEGRAFSAGSDVSGVTTDRTATETITMSQHAHVLMNKIENADKPVVAVINGYALGGGLELALACDMRVMSSTAKVGKPEVALGVAPCYGGTIRLPRLIGPSRAKDLLYTGRKLDAEESYRIGLVDRVFEPDELIEESFKLMEQIAQNAPVAVKYCKKLVDKGMEMSLAAGLAYEAEIAGLLSETYDAKEGMKAFQEKRRPEFKNK